MPRLGRADATRVIAALRRLTELDGASADDLEIARVVSRLLYRTWYRTSYPDAESNPCRNASGTCAAVDIHVHRTSNLRRTSRRRP